MVGVVNLKHGKPYDVRIDRKTIWGNPFKIDKNTDRQASISQYLEYLKTNIKLLRRLYELKDRTLACWCKPLACHGDILAEFADALPERSSPDDRFPATNTELDCAFRDLSFDFELPVKRVLITGSREITDPLVVDRCMDRVDYRPSVIIHGGARGADLVAAHWAKMRGVKCIEVPADWDKYGKSAGFIRNQRMLDEYDPEAVVAMWANNSKGTKHMIDRARSHRRDGQPIPVDVFLVREGKTLINSNTESPI